MGSQRQKMGWGLVGWWILASVIGFLIGCIPAIVLTYAIVMRFHPEETNLIGGVCIGAAIGLAQVFSARRVLSLKWVWVLGVIVGMGVPWAVGLLLSEAWFGGFQVSRMWLTPIVIVAGALAGLIQVGALTRYTPKAYWWVWLSVMIWGVTWLVTFAFTWDEPMFNPFVVVLVHGALSGASLIWLIRTSSSNEAVDF